uniref:Myotubularin phosphatase domain-containing protein n=1 Tax=Panagrellus redivivus TaxID=6233 RepID=A0A7E4W0B3_PANRE
MLKTDIDEFLRVCNESIVQPGPYAAFVHRGCKTMNSLRSSSNGVSHLGEKYFTCNCISVHAYEAPWMME